MKKSLAGLSLIELEELLSPLPRFRAGQIYKWITNGCISFNDMTNIPLSLQKELSEKFLIFSGSVACCHDDNETKKIAINLSDGAKIEAVLLNDGKNRYTACLSTQVGCPCGCVFCKTGSLGFKRNLESHEITEQLLFLLSSMKTSKAGKKKEHIIDNIVIMGMGEPFLNLDNLRKSINIITDPKGLNFSKRRITVSTCGICDGIFELAENGPYIRLALSLTTADESLRQQLMPISAANPLQAVKEALLVFQRKSGQRITLEVPLLGGINTRDIDAKSIADFAKTLDTVINIIPWNHVSGLSFNGKPLLEPSKRETEEYINILKSNKLKVTIRLHKGRSVMGACGQLGAL